jgi:hypothetical protein
MIDVKQAQTLITQLREAASPRPLDPALRLNLAKARREVEAAFAQFNTDRNWWADASSSGLVEAGIAAIGRWLRHLE